MNTITNRMSGDEAALWTQLSTFAFDGADPHQTPQLTFAARLARENGWDTAYTGRVLTEYRRFLFLCCVTPSGVTPSDPVDQAWHLHLTYTKSYWVDLCRNTLGREIHHNPTKGGSSEGEKFNGMYTHSQELYIQYFGETPPIDIWPTNQQRFSDIDFERVNRRTNWVIRKPNWIPNRTVWTGIGLVAVAGLFLQATSASILLLFTGFGLFTWLIYWLTTVDFSSNTNRNKQDGDGSGAFIFSDSSSSDDNDGHGSDGHGDSDGGHGGDSGCSASGCSSGCGGGCGGGD